MDKPVPVEIRGVKLLTQNIFWKNDAELIIPDGEKLSNVFDKMPYGRINKKVPGIGATTLEIKSKRNSIIVVPTQYLASTKADEHKIFYVGGDTTKFKSPTPHEIQNYVNDTEISPKKIICVADSLKRVMDAIGKDLNDWFIMLDEIDSYQEQANFRDKLELALDYYKLFDRKKHCVVSATLREFTDPYFDDNKEPELVINYPVLCKRKIHIINTNNVIESALRTIMYFKKDVKEKDRKIVIALNWIYGALEIINKLPKDLQVQCSILCSKYSVGKAGNYFSELDEGILPSNINFLTSTYFTGIDIYDKYHLVYVSTVEQLYTLLSVDKMYQIYGRSRIQGKINNKINNGVKSETFITDAGYKKLKENDISVEYIKDFAETMVKVANCQKINLRGRFSDILDMKEIKRDHYKNATFMGYRFIRQDKDKEYAISYFNIDLYIEDQKVYDAFYKSQTSILKEIIASGSRFSLHGSLIDERVNRTSNSSNKSKNLYDVTMNSRDYERHVAMNNIMDNLEKLDINHLIQESTGEERKFYYFFRNLSDFFARNELAQKLFHYTKESFSPKRLRNFERATQFALLEDDHIFKEMFHKQFIVDERYSPDEVFGKINEIYTHPFIGLTAINTPDKAMEELNVFLNVQERPSKTKNNPDRKRLIISFDKFDLLKIKSEFGVKLINRDKEKYSKTHRFKFKLTY